MEPLVLNYNEALVRSAVWSFWRRTVGWGFVIALSLLGVAIVALFVSGDRSWLLGVFVSSFLLGALFLVVLFVVHYRGSLHRFHRMKEPKAILELFEDKFRLSSDVGSSEMNWNTVSELWKFEPYWLVFFSKAQFVTLPLDSIEPEVQQFIESQVRKNGGKVT